MKLEYTTQCNSCPWRKDARLDDIPHYDRGMHERLGNTCMVSGLESLQDHSWMACHNSTATKKYPCLGWLMHALGPGNDISVRLTARDISNIKDVRLIGRECTSFVETLRHGDFPTSLDELILESEQG